MSSRKHVPSECAVSGVCIFIVQMSCCPLTHELSEWTTGGGGIVTVCGLLKLYVYIILYRYLYNIISNIRAKIDVCLGWYYEYHPDCRPAPPGGLLPTAAAGVLREGALAGVLRGERGSSPAAQGCRQILGLWSMCALFVKVIHWENGQMCIEGFIFKERMMRGIEVPFQRHHSVAHARWRSAFSITSSFTRSSKKELMPRATLE